MAQQRLDPEKTAPFLLGPGDGPPVLLVHGFTGSPWDMRPLGERLAARGFRVRGLRLPGHGTTPEALLRVRHRDWTLAVEDALLSLHRAGGAVGVAGLSMGALLAAQAAARHPGRVSGVALLAPALRLRGPRMTAAWALTRLGLLERVRPWLPRDSTDVEDPAERADAPVLRAFPAARLRDLFHLQGLARQALRELCHPALVVTARNDHVVAPECGPLTARLLGRAASVRHISLPRGFHILPRDADREVLAEEVGHFLAAARAVPAPPAAAPEGARLHLRPSPAGGGVA